MSAPENEAQDAVWHYEKYMTDHHDEKESKALDHKWTVKATILELGIQMVHLWEIESVTDQGISVNQIKFSEFGEEADESVHQTRSFSIKKMESSHNLKALDQSPKLLKTQA